MIEIWILESFRSKSNFEEDWVKTWFWEFLGLKHDFENFWVLNINMGKYTNMRKMSKMQTWPKIWICKYKKGDSTLLIEGKKKKKKTCWWPFYWKDGLKCLKWDGNGFKTKVGSGWELCAGIVALRPKSLWKSPLKMMSPVDERSGPKATHKLGLKAQLSTDPNRV